MPTLLSNILTRLLRRESPAIEKSMIKPPMLNPPLPGTVSLPSLCRTGSDESDSTGEVDVITPELGVVDDQVRIAGNTHDLCAEMAQSQSKRTITEEPKPPLPVIVVTTFDTNEDLSEEYIEMERVSNIERNSNMLELFWNRRVTMLWEEEEDIGDRSFQSFDSYDSIDAVIGDHSRAHPLPCIEEEEEEESMYSEMSWASGTFPQGVMEDINAILAECQLTEEEIWGDWSRWIPNWCKTCRSLSKKN